MGFSLVEGCLHYTRENAHQKTKWEFRFPLFFYRRKLIFKVFINCLKYLFVIAKGIDTFTSWNISANSWLFKNTLYMANRYQVQKSMTKERRILRIPWSSSFRLPRWNRTRGCFWKLGIFDQRKCIFITWKGGGGTKRCLCLLYVGDRTEFLKGR